MNFKIETVTKNRFQYFLKKYNFKLLKNSSYKKEIEDQSYFIGH